MTRTEQNALIDQAYAIFQSLIDAIPKPSNVVCEHCGNVDATPEERQAHQRRTQLEAARDRCDKLRWHDLEDGSFAAPRQPTKEG